MVTIILPFAFQFLTNWSVARVRDTDLVQAIRLVVDVMMVFLVFFGLVAQRPDSVIQNRRFSVISPSRGNLVAIRMNRLVRV
jgi:Sec-independent protein secretion pathway component TatC